MDAGLTITWTSPRPGRRRGLSVCGWSTLLRAHSKPDRDLHSCFHTHSAPVCPYFVSSDPPTYHWTPSKCLEGQGLRKLIREELSRLFTVEARHRRLFARLLLALVLTFVVYTTGTLLIWAFEGGQKSGDIHGFGDAAFFTTVQLLTVSSQIKNPLTPPAGKIVDVGLELWAVFVVTVVAGSFATFFSSGDSG